MSIDAPHEVVSKLQAAERQLAEAIWLFFARHDLIAAHTLAVASLDLLGDLGRASGIVSPIREGTFIRDEKKAEWRRMLREAQNSFKHADRDRDAELQFFTETTKFYLLEAAILHRAITGRLTPEARVLVVWFSKKLPDLFLEGSLKQFLEAATENLDPNDFETFLSVLEQHRQQGR